MMKKIVLLTLVLLAMTTISAGANLVPMSWGFPVLVQTGSLTGLQTQTATAHDIETANIDFPSSIGSCGGIFGSAFPSIFQSADQGQSLMALDFAQQNQASYFAYPFISIGGSPIPGMGLL